MLMAYNGATKMHLLPRSAKDADIICRILSRPPFGDHWDQGRIFSANLKSFPHTSAHLTRREMLIVRYLQGLVQYQPNIIKTIGFFPSRLHAVTCTPHSLRTGRMMDGRGRWESRRGNMVSWCRINLLINDWWLAFGHLASHNFCYYY